MKYLVLNDLHLGVQRSGGTTPGSAQELRDYAQERYTALIGMADKNVIINGDMFDSWQVPTSELLNAYFTTAEWLGADTARRLWLIPGNHDLAKNSANLSSFEFMARLLVSQYAGRVFYHAGGNWIDDGEPRIYSISHVANQELLDLELSRIPDNAKTLLLHCNYDNVFAGQADHSLNLSRDQAKTITSRGITIILGHEHQGRTLMNDKVIIVGNQFPTSVSDCLDNEYKFCLEIDGDDMELIPTWRHNDPFGDYVEVDWRDLSGVDADFVRVSGDATAAEAPSAIKAISKLRSSARSFVITNAVKVEGVEGMDSLAESVEDIRTVNVIEMLLAELNEEQQVVIRRLLQEDAS